MGQYETALASLKTYMAEQRAEQWFISEIRSYGQAMTTVYQQLGSIPKFIDWLEGKVAEERMGNSYGGMMFTTVGLP